MSSRHDARRYARALFDVALEVGDAEAAAKDLADFAVLLERHDELHKALLSPAVPPSVKKGVVESVLAQAHPSSRVMGRLLVLLVERDELRILPELIDAYKQRLLEHQRVVPAEVTTAIPLTQDRVGALQQGLSQTTGMRVEIAARVDPAILGGVVARIGSRIYDGSVVSHLQRIKEHLVSSAT